MEAKSYLATSQRDKAFSILKTLSALPATPEGAEAAYLVIQDRYDQGKFEEVETLVYKLSDSGTDQNYWLAKSFIVLGEYYFTIGREEDVLDNVKMRLGKIESIGE